MNRAEIKQKYGITNALRFNPSTDEDGVADPNWLRAWDNDTRTDIHMHRDVDAAIKEDGDIDTLECSGEEVRETAKGKYTFVRVVNKKPCVSEW